MKYEKYVNIGECSITHTFEGDPAEIKQVLEAVDLAEKPKPQPRPQQKLPILPNIGFATAAQKAAEQIKQQREG